MIKLNLLNSIIGGNYRLVVMPEIPHYKSIAPILDKHPDNLDEVLANLKTISGITDPSWFDFDKGADINSLIDDSAKKYTPVEDDPYPVRMPAIHLPDSHYSRFYKAMIDLECERIRLQLLHYADEVKDDYQTRKELKSALSDIAREVNGAAWQTIFIGDDIFPAAQMTIEERSKAAKEPRAIYDYLSFKLINLYYELAILFGPILKPSDYIQAFEFEYDRGIGKTVPYDLNQEFNLALLLHQAQRAVIADKPGDANALLKEIMQYRSILESRPEALKVAAALENYIFIAASGTHITDVKQLTDKTVVSPIAKAKRDAFKSEYEKEDSALERSNIIEEQINDYDLNNCVKYESSIKYQLATFLNKQNELYLQDPAAVYVSKRTSGPRAGAQKPLPVLTAMSAKDKVACVHKRIAFLDGIDPDTQNRIMPKADYELLKTYLEDLVKNNQCPVITRRIPVISKGVTWLRYTIYLIHGDIYHRNVQDAWIDFLYSGISNPDSPEWDVLKKKFSVAPSGYTQYVKRVIGE